MAQGLTKYSFVHCLQSCTFHDFKQDATYKLADKNWMKLWFDPKQEIQPLATEGNREGHRYGPGACPDQKPRNPQIIPA